MPIPVGCATNSKYDIPASFPFNGNGKVAVHENISLFVYAIFQRTAMILSLVGDRASPFVVRG